MRFLCIILQQSYLPYIKSDKSIKEGIEWCLSHKDEADEMCRKAYEKVKKCYDTSVIYELYRQLYRKLL